MNHTSVTRRKLLLAILGAVASSGVLSRIVLANNTPAGTGWNHFVHSMKTLADHYDAKQVTQQQLIKQALEHIQTLDTQSASFSAAVNNAYESGNEFWLWQRLLKEQNVNGGILNIDHQQVVQLHDHPQATGILRILSGEAEVWQYDRLNNSSVGNTTKLQLTSRRILRAGDTAVLTPEHGNIHALRSISTECRMLDFFIPPYQLQQRCWFEPLTRNWQEQRQLTCRTISHLEHTRT